MICLLASGGLDSTVTWAVLRQRGEAVVPLHVDYGQPSALCELRATTAIALVFQAELHVVRVTSLYREFPEDQALPARNLMMLALGAAWALSNAADTLAVGFVAAEPEFPDATTDFLDCVANALRHGGAPIRLDAPLARKSKGEVLKLGLELDAPVSLTYSCYAGRPGGCGKCAGCRLREAAFATLDVQ